MIQKSGDAAQLISACPVEKAAGTTSTDVTNLNHAVAASIEANRLIAGFGIRLLGVQIGGLKFVSLRFGEAEFSRAHAYIMKHLSDLSIRRQNRNRIR